jgi:DNA-directed RNA polymerase specialized sigma24 family protein
MAGPLTLLQAAAVACWYDEFAPHLRHFIGATLDIADDAPDVDDLLHETFVRLLPHVARLTAMEAAHRRNCAYQAARWTVADYRRRSVRRFRDAVPLSAVADSTMEPVTASHDWQAVMQPEQTTAARMSLRAVWDATPPEMRDLLLLLVAGASPAEMAHVLHLTQHAVNMRVHRLRLVLRNAAERIA